jgi:PhnB protein
MTEPITYPTVIPYLILRNSDKFISFVKNVFDAEELNVFRKEDGSILHAEVKIGNSVIMMGEAGEQYPVQTAGLYVNVMHADTNFNNALQNGAHVVNPLEDKEYGRTCGVKDSCGNTWWITSGLTSK